MPDRSKFVTEFLKDGNATRAAEASGYSHPNNAGPRLLKNKWVKAELAKSVTPAMRKREVSLDNLTSMAFDVHDAEDAKAGDRLKAIETVARLHKMFDQEVTHKHEHRFIGVAFEDVKTLDGEWTDLADTDPAQIAADDGETV